MKSNLSKITALVDGSNIALDESRTPHVERLHAVRRALEKAGFRRVEIVCDATLRHRFRDVNLAEYEEFERGLGKLWVQVPAGTSTDRVVLERLKADQNAVVVSNDTYSKEKDEQYRPVDLEDRRIKTLAYGDSLQLIYPQSWATAPVIVEPYTSPPDKGEEQDESSPKEPTEARAT